MSQKDYRADLIYKTLQRNYPEEIKKVQQMQHKDMSLYGKIQPATDAYMNQLMDRVVADNKKRREQEQGE